MLVSRGMLRNRGQLISRGMIADDGPTLDLQWSSGGLQVVRGGVTPVFTRDGEATRITQAGLVESVAAGVQAVDWVPELGGWAGRLEAQATNTCPYSDIQTGWVSQVSAAWTPGTGNAPTVVPSPATRVQVTSNGSSGVRYTRTATQAAGIWTASVWAKSNVPGVSQLFRLSHYNSVDGSTYSPVFTVTDTWQRYHVTATLSEASRQINILSSGLAEADILVWGAHLGPGGLSSLIITNGSEKVRTADALTLPTTGWFNPAAGTFVAESGIYPGTIETPQRRICGVNSNTNNRIEMSLAHNATSDNYGRFPYMAIGDGAGVVYTNSGNKAAPGPREITAMAYTTALSRYARNGVSAEAAGAYSGAAAATLTLGNGGNINGYIRAELSPPESVWGLYNAGTVSESVANLGK